MLEAYPRKFSFALPRRNAQGTKFASIEQEMAARRTYYRQILKRAKSVRAVEACDITSTFIAFKGKALPAGCIWRLPGSLQIVPLGHHGVRSGVSRATAANIPRRSSSIDINMRAG